jgi:hypothetical protein
MIMRITDLLNEQQLDELTFMGSQCTKDCSGHRAGYKWSLDRGGVENPASPSQSFINGSNIGVRQLQQNKQKRTQGGGRISGYQSQTANAVRKRQQRAQAKVDQGVHGTPMDESQMLSEDEIVHSVQSGPWSVAITKHSVDQANNPRGPKMTAQQFLNAVAKFGNTPEIENHDPGERCWLHDPETNYSFLVFRRSAHKGRQLLLQTVFPGFPVNRASTPTYKMS